MSTEHQERKRKVAACAQQGPSGSSCPSSQYASQNATPPPGDCSALSLARDLVEPGETGDDEEPGPSQHERLEVKHYLAATGAGQV